MHLENILSIIVGIAVPTALKIWEYIHDNKKKKEFDEKYSRFVDELLERVEDADNDRKASEHKIEELEEKLKGRRKTKRRRVGRREIEKPPIEINDNRG